MDEEEIEDNLDFSIWEESTEAKPNSLTLWLVFLIASAQKKHYIPDLAIEALLQIFWGPRMR